MHYILVSAVFAVSLCSFDAFAGKNADPDPRSPIMTRAQTSHYRNPVAPGAPKKPKISGVLHPKKLVFPQK